MIEKITVVPEQKRDDGGRSPQKQKKIISKYYCTLINTNTKEEKAPRVIYDQVLTRETVENIKNSKKNMLAIFDD